MYDDGCGHHKYILCSTAFWRREAAVQGADGAARLALDAQPAVGERVARSAARAHTTSLSPLSQRASPPHYIDHSTHTLVPLSSIPGFKLQEQQRCQICKHATSWAVGHAPSVRRAVKLSSLSILLRPINMARSDTGLVCVSTELIPSLILATEPRESAPAHRLIEHYLVLQHFTSYFGKK